MKHGEKQPVKTKSSEWVRALKLAVINEDRRSLQSLSNSIPESFENESDLYEASALTKQAIELMNSQKKELGSELAKLKKVRKYL